MVSSSRVDMSKKCSTMSSWTHSWTFRPLQMRPPGCLRTSNTNNPVTRCHIPEAWPQLHRCERLKTRMLWSSFVEHHFTVSRRRHVFNCWPTFNI